MICEVRRWSKGEELKAHTEGEELSVSPIHLIHAVCPCDMNDVHVHLKGSGSGRM